MKASFRESQSLGKFQSVIDDIYALPDDRLYSLWDLLTQQQRFTMRTLKGIRKNDLSKVEQNLLISFSWLMAIANRLHIDLETETYRRFPGHCSYCLEKPCVCKKQKVVTRKLGAKPGKQSLPKSLAAFQAMFENIYPSKQRTIEDAGIHLAEEMGEVSEAIHNFLGEHKAGQFREIQDELADYVSCVFGVANSANINMAAKLASMYSSGCHVCHKAPCECTFQSVITIKT